MFVAFFIIFPKLLPAFIIKERDRTYLCIGHI
jgi:hypothetical protein